MKRQLTIVGALAFVLAAGGVAPAATITGVSIEDVSSELTTNFNRAAVHTVNESGLGVSGPGTHTNQPDGYMWLSAGNGCCGDPPDPHVTAGDGLAHITFDLGDNYDLDSFHVWNYNEVASGLSTRGADNVTISVASSEGGSFTALPGPVGGDFTFAKATGLTSYTGETIDLSPYGAADDTRLIRFDINSSHSGDNDFAGLSEVQFDGALISGAVPIAVPNYSFQQPAQAAGKNNSPITDWTISGNGGGVFFPDGNGFGNPLPDPALGSQYAYLETPNNNAPSSITTTSPVATVAADTTYTLTAAVGYRNTSNRLPDNYLIELLVDGTPAASNTLDDARSIIPASTFMDLSTSFTSPSSGGTVGGALTIRLTHSTDDGTFRQGAYDNIRLTAEPTGSGVIPEPMTMLAVGLGLAGLGRYVRRRKA